MLFELGVLNFSKESFEKCINYLQQKIENEHKKDRKNNDHHFKNSENSLYDRLNHKNNEMFET
jgi:hypothetical protein